jgi:hypothetical protein
MPHHCKAVLHVDDQVVGGAAPGHLDVGRELDELEGPSGKTRLPASLAGIGGRAVQCEI